MFIWFPWEEQASLTACLNIMFDTDGRDKGQTAGEGLSKKKKKNSGFDLLSYAVLNLEQHWNVTDCSDFLSLWSAFTFSLSFCLWQNTSEFVLVLSFPPFIYFILLLFFLCHSVFFFKKKGLYPRYSPHSAWDVPSLCFFVEFCCTKTLCDSSPSWVKNAGVYDVRER